MTSLILICGFKDIYDQLNTDGQHSLIDVKIKNVTQVFNTCTNRSITQANGNQQFIPKPKSIQINQGIINNLYNAITDEEDTISEVPIYFVVLKNNNDGYTHISLFIYFKKWFSIGLSQCGLSYPEPPKANLLTPDNIFNTITYQLFVIDFGILNQSHIDGINEYIGYINYNDSHYNTKSNYYTYNLNKSYKLDITTKDSKLYNCAKFILTIFGETILCSTTATDTDTNISISNLSRINTNLVVCESISLDMKITDFLQVSAGSSNRLSYYICKLTSMLRGGSSIKRKPAKNKINNKNKKKKNKTIKKISTRKKK